MHRRPLLALLAAYREAHPDEAETAERVETLVRAHSDCFERSCLPGHITGSAWIVSPERDRFLLTHHRKLGRWLQLGGHADGDHDVHAVALREAREESGMQHFGFHGLPAPAEGSGTAAVLPLDIDVHRIPARPGEPEHEHHDIRFLLVADAGQEIQISDESLDLRWFARGEAASVCEEESLGRLARKAAALLGDG